MNLAQLAQHERDRRAGPLADLADRLARLEARATAGNPQARDRLARAHELLALAAQRRAAALGHP